MIGYYSLMICHLQKVKHSKFLAFNLRIIVFGVSQILYTSIKMEILL